MFDTKDKGMGISLLKYFCDASFGQIAEMFNATLDSKNNIFVPSENDSKVLFVAHMDVVTDRPAFTLAGDKNTIVSSKLDDRLGIYAAYILKYKYKVDFDILLTDEEEHCNSSAQFFKSAKQYNWMFQFDRAGNNHVVMYQYENSGSEKLLNSVGLQLQMGSYSDICELSHLGCIGFNFAVAYYKQHSPNCYMKIDEFKNQVRKFMKFYNLYKDHAMPFDNVTYEKEQEERRQRYLSGYHGSRIGSSYGTSAFWDDEYYDWYYGKHSHAQAKAIELHENEKVKSQDIYKNAQPFNDNDNYWEEAKYFKRYSNNKHTVRRAKNQTKVIDFRKEEGTNRVMVADQYAKDMQDFNDENDRQLNEFFGGVVEKNGVLVNIVWRGGVAFYEPVDGSKTEIKPEIGSREWYLEIPADFEQSEKERQMILANAELDRQMEYSMAKEI